MTFAVLLVAGCSSKSVEPKPNPVESIRASIDAMPKCADLWVEGRRLPADYDGCIDEDGSLYSDGVEEGPTCHTYEPDGHGYFVDVDGVIRDGGEMYAGDKRYAAAADACQRLP